MKLAFSTLGCPDWSFGDVFSIASDLGFNGIEIRGIADELYAPNIKEFNKNNINKTINKLKNANISLPILTSGAYLGANDNINSSIEEIKNYIILAAELGAPYVRVMGECEPDPRYIVNQTEVLENYINLCKFANNYNIILLIETNGYLADSNKMREFMERAGQSNMGVLWDIHHTYRFFNESPEETVNNIGGFIKHVHVKDSVKGTNGKITYMLTGYGDIPVENAYKALNKINYSGFYSYEWVKRWSRELAEPGISFFQYINYMRELG